MNQRKMTAEDFKPGVVFIINQPGDVLSGNVFTLGCGKNEYYFIEHIGVYTPSGIVNRTQERCSRVSIEITSNGFMAYAFVAEFYLSVRIKFENLILLTE